MRRSNFFLGALVALVTFVSLSAFVGQGRRNGYRGWRYHRCYYNDRYYDRTEHNRREPVQDTTTLP